MPVITGGGSRSCFKIPVVRFLAHRGSDEVSTVVEQRRAGIHAFTATDSRTTEPTFLAEINRPTTRTPRARLALLGISLAYALVLTWARKHRGLPQKALKPPYARSALTLVSIALISSISGTMLRNNFRGKLSRLDSE